MVSQEAFDLVSSRTYVSAVERGLKQPTIAKIDEFASVLELHPLSLLTLAYVGRPSSAEVDQLLAKVKAELAVLLAGAER